MKNKIILLILICFVFLFSSKSLEALVPAFEIAVNKTLNKCGRYSEMVASMNNEKLKPGWVIIGYEGELPNYPKYCETMGYKYGKSTRSIEWSLNSSFSSLIKSQIFQLISIWVLFLVFNIISYIFLIRKRKNYKFFLIYIIISLIIVSSLSLVIFPRILQFFGLIEKNIGIF